MSAPVWGDESSSACSQLRADKQPHHMICLIHGHHQHWACMAPGKLYYKRGLDRVLCLCMCVWVVGTSPSDCLFEFRTKGKTTDGFRLTLLSAHDSRHILFTSKNTKQSDGNWGNTNSVSLSCFDFKTKHPVQAGVIFHCLSPPLYLFTDKVHFSLSSFNLNKSLHSVCVWVWLWFLMRKTDTRVAKQCAWSTYHLVSANDDGLSQHKLHTAFRPSLSPIQCLQNKSKAPGYESHCNFTNLAQNSEIIWDIMFLCLLLWLQGTAKCVHRKASDHIHHLYRCFTVIR